MIRFRLKELLDEYNETMYSLAKKTDLTYTAIYQIGKDKTNGIQFHTLEEIMSALDITDFNKILEIVPDKD